VRTGVEEDGKRIETTLPATHCARTMPYRPPGAGTMEPMPGAILPP
jgi:hypothetical protein